jgi:hypothetical protein
VLEKVRPKIQNFETKQLPTRQVFVTYRNCIAVKEGVLTNQKLGTSTKPQFLITYQDGRLSFAQKFKLRLTLKSALGQQGRGGPHDTQQGETRWTL